MVQCPDILVCQKSVVNPLEDRGDEPQEGQRGSQMDSSMAGCRSGDSVGG